MIDTVTEHARYSKVISPIKIKSFYDTFDKALLDNNPMEYMISQDDPELKLTNWLWKAWLKVTGKYDNWMKSLVPVPNYTSRK